MAVFALALADLKHEPNSVILDLLCPISLHSFWAHMMETLKTKSVTKKQNERAQQTFGIPSQRQVLFVPLCLCQIFAFLKL